MQADVATVAVVNKPARRQRYGALLWWAAALLITFAGAWWVWTNRIPEAQLSDWRTPAPAIGRLAPPFVGMALDGSAMSLADYAGQPVMLNFWATWCGPCRNEMPALERAAQRYKGKLTILGINQGESRPTIAPFVEEFGLTFPIVLDEEQAIGADLYEVSGLPTTYFVDKSGVIRRLWIGEMNSIAIEEGIAEILQSPTP